MFNLILSAQMNAQAMMKGSSEYGCLLCRLFHYRGPLVAVYAAGIPVHKKMPPEQQEAEKVDTKNIDPQ
jgi:hypothetical protein